MTDSSSPPPKPGLSLEGIEVVELSDVDLEFDVEEVFGKRAAPPPVLELDSTRTEPATADDLRAVELFQGLESKDIDALAPRCQSIHAVPGYVLLAPGRIDNKVYFVIEGQLRLYARTSDKRPTAVADIGHSTGLRSALAMQPAEHAVIATEVSHVLAVDVSAIDEYVKRSHTFARNYAALLARYVRGDHCLHVGGRPPGGTARESYVDELTLLHNQHWLDTVYPRLVTRCRLGNKPLAVVGFAIDQLDDVVKASGIGPGLRVLEAVGHWLLDQTRPTDLLAVGQNRYLYAFLPDCDLDAARQLADRLKVQARTLPVTLAPGKPAMAITLALGIAELEKGMREKEFLVRTEALIRKSVRLGGNCVSETQ